MFSRKFIIILMALLSLEALAQENSINSKESSSGRNKIEELFIWKISDELRLSTKEEKSFSDLFRELNKKKSDIGREQDEIITKLSQSKSSSERTKLLNRYRKLIDEYNKLQTQEFDQIKKIVGTEKMPKYLQVKRDLTNKVKSLLTEKTEKREADLPPPTVIQE